jgi:hypothetical protein
MSSAFIATQSWKASVAVRIIVGLKGVAISLLLGAIHVPSLQTTSVFIIEELIRNLQHGVPRYWVNVLNFESSPPLGANVFVLESIEQKKLDIWGWKDQLQPTLAPARPHQRLPWGWDALNTIRLLGAITFLKFYSRRWGDE